MKTQILKAPDITCDHCERVIKEALRSVPGVQQVEVDILSQEVHLTYDENQVGPMAIEAILAKEGYPVAVDGIPVQVRSGGSCCGGACHI